MGDSCSCGDTTFVPVDVHQRILAGDDRAAGRNRERFETCGIVAVNLMGSRGSGKTALLEATVRAFGGKARLGVLGGDFAADNDGRRIRDTGIVAGSSTSGTEAHLDAEMVHQRLRHLPWRTLDYLFIENVGHPECPAVYDLGQAVNVVALSVAEGEDKPLKYPLMFRNADLVLVTKVDLLSQLPEINLTNIEHNVSFVMPHPAMLPVSAKTGQGIDLWLRWLGGVGHSRGARCAVPTMAGAQ
jgi:hydrogenase nickel incorporation protein HypB